MTWAPRLVRCQIIESVYDLGYPLQVLYEHGYAHNNCGGGCVLAGLSQWHGLYLDYPERFAYHERREAAFNEGREKPFTVLRDQSGGSVSPLSLATFRERIERNDQTLNLQQWRSTCGCMHAEQGNLFEALDLCF